MITRLVRRGSAALRPAAALAVFGTLLAGCAPAERAVAPELQAGRPRFDVSAAETPVVFITEVMSDPSVSGDTPGEWFEIFNAGTQPVNLRGWQLRSGSGATGTEQVVLSAAADVIVPAGGYLVLGQSSNSALNGGITNVGLVYPTITLGNNNTDWIQLRRPEPAGTTNYVSVDSVSWANRASGTPVAGQPSTNAARVLPASELYSTAVGRRYIAGTGSLWVTSTADIIGTNGRGTPGTGDYVAGGGNSCVTPGAIAQVTLAPATATVVIGGAQVLTASATDASGCVVQTAFTWTNATPATATLNTGATTPTNTATGVAVGQTTITAAAGGLTASATLTVTLPPSAMTSRISFSGFNDAPLPPGYEDQIFATPRNASNAVVATTITWTALTPELATIDARGVVRGVAAGRALFEARAGDNDFKDTAFVDVAVPVDPTTAAYANHLEFGRPTDDTPGDDFLVQWPEFVSSYNRDRGQSNWIAYNLEATHRGPTERCDCFTHDPSLPTDFPRLSTDDYTGSGYSRGHMVMSEDRTTGPAAPATSVDNARTFLFTNIVPQTSQNNGGAWLGLEEHLGNLATGGTREIFIYAGGARYEGTLNNAGRIAIPTRTWKIAVILTRNKGLADVDDPSDVEVIAVDMPNTTTIPQVKSDWPKYRVSVDSIEKLTGYDFLSNLPNTLEEIIESGDRRPDAVFTGATSGLEGQTLTFDGTGSSDADVGGPLNDVVSFLWSVNGDNAGITPSLTRTFADNGSYTVRLIVSDRFGWADTTTSTVSIGNVAPAVGAFAGATILRGETYAAAGAFADPGADTWTATVNYGDGTGAQPLALTGKSFALSHTYATAGSYTVTVSVTDDDDGTDTRTATVVVETAVEGVGNLADLVQQLGANASLPRAEANSLAAKLRASAQLLASQPDRPAGVAILEAFINEITAMQQSGRLSADKATQLIDYARRVIAAAGA